MADEIKKDPFLGFLVALSKIDLKLEDEEMNIKKRDFY